MKKALSLTLALVICICLTLVPMTALAYGNDWIQLSKSNFDPDEDMVITLSGITAGMLDDIIELNIRAKGAAADDFIGGIPLSEETAQRVVFGAPPNSGDYELVLWNGATCEVITYISFTVGKIAKAGSIALDKPAYTALEAITVTVTGITEQMVKVRACIGIYEKGANHNNSNGEYANVTQGSSSVRMYAPNKNGEFEMRLYSTDISYDDETFVMSVPFTVSGAMTTSGWAEDQNIAEKAAQYSLIPDSLRGADWTKPITRAEFAAVSVKLYECLADKKATPVETNPFTDTKDAEILKAFNIGVTNGTSLTLFSPNELLNREQAATMLTRALKTAYVPGWTLDTDKNYTLAYEMPDKFADDALISDWA
ncbi:MAG: hypothetical protein FWE62_06650, partial [Firmicutes bacterium]|nr:hypothetical protein [Bacillota bacterium]